MEIIILFGTLLSLSVGFFWIISIGYWCIHLKSKSTFHGNKISQWATFFQFYKKFKTINWERDPMYPTSFFGKDGNYENHIHADSIIINGEYLKLDYFSYWIFKLFCLKNKFKA